MFWPIVKNVLLLLAGVAGIAALFVVAAVLSIAAGMGEFDHHANEAELIRIFREHRPTFERLVAMSDSDPDFSRIAPRFVLPDSTWPMRTGVPAHSMSRQRWNEYRAVFDSLHLADGLGRHGSGDTAVVELTAWSKGMLDGESSKGYVFSRRPLTPLVVALEDPKAVRWADHGPVYRAIAPNWYLSYDW